MFSSRFETFSKPHSDFWHEVFVNDFQNYNYLSIATSFWRTFSLKKRFFSQSFDFKRHFSRFLIKILQQIWQKCILYIQRNNWWKTNFLKKHILLNNNGFSAICFWGLRRNFNRVAKTSHYMTHQHFEEKHFLNKTLLAEVFSDCEWKVSFGFFKHFPMFSEEVFYRKVISFQKNMSFPG